MSGNRLLYFIIILLENLYRMRAKVACDSTNHSKNCSILLENVAAASANFISCTLRNSRPVEICCSCAGVYSSVLTNFSDIVQGERYENASCHEKLLHQDRLEVIERTVDFIRGLWSEAQCNSCVENSSELKNVTKEFNRYKAETNECLSSMYNSSSHTYSPDVCTNCSSVYFRLSKFYTDLKEESMDSICMDIVDTMNVTQHLWSRVCGNAVSTVEVSMLSLTVAFLILPFVFYGFAVKDNDSEATSSSILRRNRLSQRFGERWRARAGSANSN